MSQSQTTNTTRLDDVLSLRAQCVEFSERSAEVRDTDLTDASATLVDLLSVASLLCDEDPTSMRAQEILNFVDNTALPALLSTEAGVAPADLQKEVEAEWAESLDLLEPTERFRPKVTDEWAESSESPFESGTEKAEDPSDPVAGIDIGGILSALGGVSHREEESHEQSEESAAMGSSDVQAAVDALTSMSAGRSDESPSGPSAAPTLPEGGLEPETIDDPEMVAAYGDDAQLCLSEMEASVLGIESGGDHEEGLRNFCRQLHTLKGASGTVGLTRLAAYLHELESFVEANASKGVDVDKLLEGVDIVRAQLKSLGIGGSAMDAGADFASSAAPVASSASGVSPNSVTPASKTPASAVTANGRDSELFVRVEASRLERLMDLLAELVMLRNRRDTYVESLRSLNEEMTQCSTRTRTLATMSDLATPMSLAPESSGESAESGVEYDRQSARGRLLTRSLDELSKDTGELGRSLLEVCDPLANDNAAVSHLIGRFRQELMELRRQPIGGLFQRLQRSIRDAAKAEGKQVEVEFEGRGARADRGVQERLYEPLLHLVRNAVSHGIRIPEERKQHGKPAIGRITLAGWSDAASLWIEVRDDGQGLDTEAIAARGLELGLLSKSDAEDPAQVWKLIFHPGFSTRNAVSAISGRGVGMDVVDTWVKRLRGRIDVESERGFGTTFRMQIPLRSAVEHAMIVRSGNQLFALPMHAVSGTSDSRVPLNGLPDTSREVVSFGSLIGCSDDQAAPGRCRVALRHTSPGQRLGLSDRHEEITIAVDGIVGVEEVVVRSLPSLLQRNQLFAGVTLSGRGETVLLVDVARVVELNYSPDGDQCHQKKSRRPVPVDSVTNAQESLLVVDDSVVVRRTLVRKLTGHGYRVIAAANGREALDLLKTESVLAVVTDLDMPAMNGLELCQEIRRLDQLKHLPVMVVSSRDRHTLPPELEELGSISVLAKPVNDATVSAIVQSLTSDLFPQLSDNLTSRR